MTTIQPEQILLRARDIIKERGVCQGHVDTDGACSGIQEHTHRAGTCMGTAMDDAYEQLASEKGWTGGFAHRIAEDAVMLVTGVNTPREFNDRQGVTTKDAVNAFTVAAQMVREYFNTVGPHQEEVTDEIRKALQESADRRY